MRNAFSFASGCLQMQDGGVAEAAVGDLWLLSVWVLCGMERKANAFGNKSEKAHFRCQNTNAAN